MLLGCVHELERKYKHKTCQMSRFEKLMSTRNEKKGVYNWFPFFQAFSSSFLAELFDRKTVKNSQRIMDPFAGSGNTLLACVEFGKNGYGLEVNPLFRFVAEVKTGKYLREDFTRAQNIVREAANESLDVEVPGLSSFNNLFDPCILSRLIILRNEAQGDRNKRAASLLLLALASKLLSFSYAMRYGKGLHVVRNSHNYAVESAIIEKLQRMQTDYEYLENLIENRGTADFTGDDVLEIENAEFVPTVDLVITSPPYCNSSDYVEMYKLELWFLKYVVERPEFKDLSNRTLRSHLSFTDLNIKWSHPAVEKICHSLENVQLWNSRIPLMIRGYFDDLHSAIFNISAKLEDEGKMIFVIGNSSYSGFVVPTDLLLAEAAADIGLKVDSIEVARLLPSSPQQRKTMDERSRLLMRESIVSLSR